MCEIWKDVIGYEGLYQVSNFGNIKSIDRIVWFKNMYCECQYKIKGKILKQYKNNAGYPSTVISKNGKAKHLAIHMLVTRAFLGIRPKQLEVCHYDGNRENNNLSNLRYDTRKGNCSDTVRYGKSKLTEVTKNKLRITSKNAIIKLKSNKYLWNKRNNKVSISVKKSWLNPERRRYACKMVAQMDLLGNIINRFDSIEEASLNINTCKYTISDVCKGIGITAGGYRWKFLERNECVTS